MITEIPNIVHTYYNVPDSQCQATLFSIELASSKGVASTVTQIVGTQDYLVRADDGKGVMFTPCSS